MSATDVRAYVQGLEARLHGALMQIREEGPAATSAPSSSPGLQIITLDWVNDLPYAGQPKALPIAGEMVQMLRFGSVPGAMLDVQLSNGVTLPKALYPGAVLRMPFERLSLSRSVIATAVLRGGGVGYYGGDYDAAGNLAYSPTYPVRLAVSTSKELWIQEPELLPSGLGFVGGGVMLVRRAYLVLADLAAPSSWNQTANTPTGANGAATFENLWAPLGGWSKLRITVEAASGTLTAVDLVPVVVNTRLGFQYTENSAGKTTVTIASGTARSTFLVDVGGAVGDFIQFFPLTLTGTATAVLVTIEGVG